MIVTFKTKAYSDITMFGDIALKLIKIMGHGGTVPGAIAADEVSIALQKLRSAVDQDKQGSANGADVQTDTDEEAERRVSLAQRAYPLIELLEAAEREEAPVMWNR